MILGQNRIEMKFPRTININKSCMCEREREKGKKTRWNSVSQKIEAPYLSSEDWKKGCCSRLLALQVVAEKEHSCGSFCTGRFNLSERYLHVLPSLWLDYEPEERFLSWIGWHGDSGNAWSVSLFHNSQPALKVSITQPATSTNHNQNAGASGALAPALGRRRGRPLWRK